MKTPNYLLCFAADHTGSAGWILYTKPPFFVGKVNLFLLELDYLTEVGKENKIIQRGIDGYSILITYQGTIDNRTVPTDGSVLKLLETVFAGMADFYLQERINKKPGMYARYKLMKNGKDHK